MRQLGFRMSAGYNYEEIAIMLEEHRADLRNVELPKQGPITKNWISAKMRDLRYEIAETHADLTD